MHSSPPASSSAVPKAPDGYRDGLALCVIDSVQSTGVTYYSVENVAAVARTDDQRHGSTTLSRRVDTLRSPRVQTGVPAASARRISVGLLRHMRHNARSACVRL